MSLLGDHEIVCIEHAVFGVRQQFADLFVVEHHFRVVFRGGCRGILVQILQLLEPPVGVGAHRAELQEIEDPVVASHAFRLVDDRPRAVESDGHGHGYEQGREQEDRRERCRDVERPFPERHAEQPYFVPGACDGFADECIVGHELQCAEEICARYVARHGAVHAGSEVRTPLLPGQPPRGDEDDAGAREPGTQEADAADVLLALLFVEDEGVVVLERHELAHGCADIPCDTHLSLGQLRETGRVVASAFDVDDGVLQSKIFLILILSSCGLNGLTI